MLANPICFYLDGKVIDYVYQHDLLKNIKLINHYVRCFRLGLTRKEIDAIANVGQKQYFLENDSAGIIFATWEELVPTGRIGWMPHWMAETLINCFASYVQCDGHVQRVLIQSIVIPHEYLVAHSAEEYGNTIAILKGSLERMSHRRMSKDGKKAMHLLKNHVNSLKVIDPPKFEELVMKLVDYSLKPEAQLPAEL